MAQDVITDMALNYENTMLATGCNDHVVRIFNLQNAAPLAVLTGHTVRCTRQDTLALLLDVD